MKRIERYIQSLSKDVYMRPEEKAGFQKEVRMHLMDSIEELQQKGKSQEESIAIALERFGTRKFINRELRKEVTLKRAAKYSLLKFAVACLVLSVLFIGISGFMQHRNTKDFDNMQGQYHRDLKGKIMTNGTVEMAHLQAFIERNKRILRHIHVLEKDSSGQAMEYIYSLAAGAVQTNGTSLTNGKSSSSGDYAHISYPLLSENTGTQWDVRIAYKSDVLFSPIPHMLNVFSIVSLGAYWILFGLWGVRNAYRMGRLNWGWVVLFFTLNVVAYGLFRMDEGFKVRQLKETY